MHCIEQRLICSLRAHPMLTLCARVGEVSHFLYCVMAVLYGARSPVSSYGAPGTPGTLICTNPRFANTERPLSQSELLSLDVFGDVRKLHPDEILASFSYRQHELPRLVGSLADQYKMVSQTICLKCVAMESSHGGPIVASRCVIGPTCMCASTLCSVFEAFTAEALHAMGITAPRTRLHERLQQEYPGIEKAKTELEERRDKTSGIEYTKYKTLTIDPLDEDQLSEYELARLRTMEANRVHFDAFSGSLNFNGEDDADADDDA